MQLVLEQYMSGKTEDPEELNEIIPDDEIRFYTQMEELDLTNHKEKSEITQSCPTLCDPTDCSLPGSSIHGIFQARILEWVAIFLLQEIFPTQGLNPGLPHCRQTIGYFFL